MKGGYGIGLWKCYKKGEGGGGNLFISRASLCMSFPVLYALALFKDAW